ncbi:hypothetical protein EKI60_04645 [Candidatus Saccharibacteria bacterium]|nr:MAG: hypothetical protein EKI60_04645 [Candidatus Saccharibacteria bacterium]
MTILTEGDNSLFLTAPAMIVDTDIDTASWAAAHILDNPNYKWILARYVEADNANDNGQYWTYEDLKLARPSIQYSPMNVDHHPTEIVGSWVNSEMMLPNDTVLNPYIEVLGAFWERYFPETLERVQAAYESGTLAVSMECISESVTCGHCEKEFSYAGPFSPTYCEHIQNRSAHRQLNKPNFLAGALIMPGNRPGWSKADVKDISKRSSDDEKNRLIESIAAAHPSGSPKDWEDIMWGIQMQYLRERTNGV